MVSRAIIFTFLANIFFAATSLANLPQPITQADFHPVEEAQAKLGQLLFYDKLLSGNRNISCGTCHHPAFGTSDGLSLGIGEGGEGVGPERTFGEGQWIVEKRIPRNSPSLWNLGAKEFTVLFHDGRAYPDEIFPSGFNSPAEEFLPTGLNDIVAVQAMFPVTSKIEMAGDKNENEVPGAVTRRIDYAWDILVDRIRHTAGYPDMFVDAFDDIETAADISMVHVANALSAFQRFEFQATNSAFDRYLRGDKEALNERQVAGMNLFYGEAGCASCHSGALQTDHDFHNLALPFIGPGRTRLFEHKARDMGRINETDLAADAYKFRTPSLRNVTETAPYGHNGAYSELRDMILHHTNPVQYFQQYRLEKAILPAATHLGRDDILWPDTQENRRILSTVTGYTVELSDQEIDLLIAFLETLTDEESLLGRLGIPVTVPSKLSVDQVNQ